MDPEVLLNLMVELAGLEEEIADARATLVHHSQRDLLCASWARWSRGHQPGAVVLRSRGSGFDESGIRKVEIVG